MNEELIVQELIAQARQAVKKGEFDQAEILYGRASKLEIKIYNDDMISAAATLAGIGHEQLMMLNYKKAKGYFEGAAELLQAGNAGNDEILAGYLKSAQDCSKRCTRLNMILDGEHDFRWF